MPHTPETSSPTGSEAGSVNINFRMPERDRRDLKLWCVAHDLTMTEAFVEGAALLRALRDLFGPLTAEELLGVVGRVGSIEIDKGRDLSLERRGPDAWAVRDGASVINRDGEREHEPMPSSRDEAFIARTRFGLAEALRVARARLGGDL